MFKSNHPKPGGNPKWDIHPKAPAKGGKGHPTTPGAGYTGARRPSSTEASYPTKPAKGG